MCAYALDKKKQASTPIGASVQGSFVALREVRHDVLCLSVPGSPRKRVYRAVIKIEGINFLLKGEEEQMHLTDFFGHFLAGLAHPIQIMMRVLPLNMAPYLEHLQPEGEPEQGAQSLALRGRSATPSRTNDVWQALAQSQAEFFTQLAARRQLLERHFYLVIPADDEPMTGSGEAADLAQVLGPIFGTARRARAQDLEFASARQQLDLRVGEVLRQMATMGLYSRRLEKKALVKLYYSCLTPQRAVKQPLHDGLIERAERPFEALSGSGRLTSPTLIEVPTAETQPHSRTAKAGKKKARETTETLDFAQLADLLAPASISLQPDCLAIEGEVAKTLVIRGLPRYVGLTWLKPFAELDEPMTVNFFFRPRNSAYMIRHLRRRQLEYNSSTMMASQKGNSVDPDLQIARGDVAELIGRLASGEERMLEFGMHVQLRGKNRRELAAREDRVESVLHNMLLLARPANYEQDRAFRSDMPHARNELGDGLVLPTGALKTFFMFLSNSLFQQNGILEGITPGDEPVVLDWWSPAQRNANRLIVAPSGTGKSFKTKLDLLRQFLLYCRNAQSENAGQQPAFQGIIVDPEREYRRLTRDMLGQWIRLAPGSHDHINPFDLPSAEQQMADADGSRGDVLADKIQQLHALMDILLSDRTALGAGTLSSSEKGLLDRALYATYRSRGITSDVRTHNRPAPLMRDLYKVLESGGCGPDPTGLAQRLQRFVVGSLSGIFDGPTNVALNNAIVCFDTHDLDGDLRAVGIFLITQYVWSISFGSRIPRQLVVDEMMSLYQYAEGARFLETLFARSRKHYLGVTGLTQHVGLLVNSSIPTNCAVQILMAQEPASIPLVAEVFKLSEREIEVLKRCGKGDALLLTNDKRIFVHFEASEVEHRIATTDPREVASWETTAPVQTERAQPRDTQRADDVVGKIVDGLTTGTTPLPFNLLTSPRDEVRSARRTTDELLSPPSALAQLAGLVQLQVYRDDVPSEDALGPRRASGGRDGYQ